MNLFSKLLHLSMFTLCALCLFLPFVYMKIGPGGYEFYGPDVPDIWIYGGDIFGKDKGFWGIQFAYLFQRMVIVFYLLITLLSYRFVTTERSILIPSSVNLLLLLLFPMWMEAYVEGVVGNSDGADLTIYYTYGWWLYGALVVLNLLAVIYAIVVKVRGRRSS